MSTAHKASLRGAGIDRWLTIGRRHNAPVPNPRLGYALTVISAACSAVNGSLARYLLDDGMSAARLSQLRSAVAFALLLGGLALFSPRRLRIARTDVPKLAWLGIAGIALVHASYFAAIARIDIGVALVIQYLAPALLLIWLRVVHKRHAAPSLWAAVALSLAGCALVVDAPAGATRPRRGRRARRARRRGHARDLPRVLRARRPALRRVHDARLGLRLRDAVLARRRARLDLSVRAARLRAQPRRWRSASR